MKQAYKFSYKFSINLEGFDDFHFEIDILPSQSFLDFHQIIQNVLQFSGTELASFYLSNSTWKKKTEISLIDMNIDDDTGLYEDGDDDKPKKKKTLLMSDTKLATLIDDPHQRFIYIYDFLTPWTLYIELIKIIDTDNSIKYPVCSKISGELPTKKTNITLKVPPTEEDIIDITSEDIDEETTEESEFNVFGDEESLDEGFDELKLE